MEHYNDMRARHQAEVNALPLKFAFGRDQFKRMLEEWNITEEEARNGAIYSLSGSGGYYLASDSDLIRDTFKRISKEEKAAIAEDLTGEGYIYEMFYYELNNHEFSYTGDISETLDALGLTAEEVNSNKALQNGLKKAIKSIYSSDEDL